MPFIPFASTPKVQEAAAREKDNTSAQKFRAALTRIGGLWSLTRVGGLWSLMRVGGL